MRSSGASAARCVGPFTGFAPTYAAFAALLTELGVTLEQLVALLLAAGVLAFALFRLVPSELAPAEDRGAVRGNARRVPLGRIN